MKKKKKNPDKQFKVSREAEKCLFNFQYILKTQFYSYLLYNWESDLTTDKEYEFFFKYA